MSLVKLDLLGECLAQTFAATATNDNPPTTEQEKPPQKMASSSVDSQLQRLLAAPYSAPSTSLPNLLPNLLPKSGAPVREATDGSVVMKPLQFVLNAQSGPPTHVFTSSAANPLKKGKISPVVRLIRVEKVVSKAEEGVMPQQQQQTVNPTEPGECSR